MENDTVEWEVEIWNDRADDKTVFKGRYTMLYDREKAEEKFTDLCQTCDHVLLIEKHISEIVIKEKGA